MTNPTRRRFLKIASASVAGAAFGPRAGAATPVLGLIFPPANTPVPPEARLMYPAGVEFRATGVGLERMTPEGYDQVVDRIVPAAKSMAAQGANAIAVMGTSLTFYKGAAFNKRLQDSAASATGLPAVTMSTAIIEGLKAVGGHRLTVATAYNEEVNQRLRTFLEESGFEILELKGMGIERFEDRPPVTSEELLNFSAGVSEMAPKSDALLISCGALKTLQLLAPLEQRCQVPVVSSLPTPCGPASACLGSVAVRPATDHCCRANRLDTAPQYCVHDGRIIFAAIRTTNLLGASLSPTIISWFFAPEIAQLLPAASPSSPTRATFSAVSALRNTRSGCCAISWNSVLVEPGQSAQTRTPNSASSSAMPSAKIRSKAFVAAYAELNGTA